MLLANHNYDTLTSLSRSKFSDSQTPPYTPPNTPNTSSLALESDPQAFIQIPYRNNQQRIFAWVHPLDHFGPGPNTQTRYTVPSPEFYPINILVPTHTPADVENVPRHIWDRQSQLEYLTWSKFKGIITGKRPVVLCGDERWSTTCPICRHRSELLYVGREVEIGGDWGKGKIAEVIGHETEHVIAKVRGPEVRTNSQTAKIRIPITSFHLGRLSRLHRKFLAMRRKLRDAPQGAVVTPTQNVDTSTPEERRIFKLWWRTSRSFRR